MSMETDRIEADLDQSRHRLNDTLNALGNKLSPGQMVDEVLGLAQGQAGQFAAKLGSQVRDNPMPTILIAAGIAWLMLDNRHGASGENLTADDWRHERRYRSLEEARWSTPRMINESDEAYEERIHAAYAKALDLKQMAGEAAHDFKERVAMSVNGARQAAASVRERMAGAVSKVADGVHDQALRIGDKVSGVRDGAVDFYQDTPLAAGAIALAVGALLGSATPLSDPERNALEGVASNSARTGANLAKRAARLVDETVDSSIH